MNQEFIFRTIGTAGLGRGFTAGAKLPKEKGSLKEFKIVRLTAIEAEDYSALEKQLIEKLGESPKRNYAPRARQLQSLLEKQVVKDKILIIIISKAHLLDSHTLQCLKSLRELVDKGKNPGVVLLGKMDILTDIIKKIKSVEQRTTLLPG